MKRRNFLKNIGKLSSAPLLINGIGLKAFASPAMLDLLTTCEGIEERSVVVLFMKGGNDGLNTILPVDQYATYIGHRPNIGLAESGTGAYMNLDSTLDIADQVGIHPAAASFKEMYEAGKARLVQAVGYPSFNQSHFKSTDLWLGGRDGTQGAASSRNGWIGRFFENAYPGIHGNPTLDFPDPLGLQLGDRNASLSFHDCTSTYEAVNISSQNLSDLFGLLNGLGTAPHDTLIPSEYGTEIDYIMGVEDSTNVYGQRITEVYNAGINSSTIYPNSSLGEQLATVARLLAGGCKTKVFQAHKDGFDTHGGQVDSGSPYTGRHANLLEDVFDSIKAFHEDLSNLGLGQKVVTVVFSEFSRRITENGSLGTDHGNVGPMFLFGDGVKPGISGTNFDLTAINASGNMLASEIQYDYRSIFKTVLQNWMGAGEDILLPAQMDAYPVLDELIDPDQIVDPSCYIDPLPLPIELSYFSARLNQEKQVELEWETTTEYDLDHFEIIRWHADGQEESIATISPKGFASGGQFYEILDREPLKGESYYRLKSVNQDATIEYSDWKAISLKESIAENVKIYPNPAIYDFNLVLTAKTNGKANLEIVALSGQIIYNESIKLKKGFNKFPVDVTNISDGHYWVKLSGEGLEPKTMKIVILNK